MKSELRVKPHGVLPGQNVFEIWFNGELMGTIAGADGPGIRIISKHTLLPQREPVPPMAEHVSIVRVGIQP